MKFANGYALLAAVLGAGALTAAAGCRPAASTADAAPAPPAGAATAEADGTAAAGSAAVEQASAATGGPQSRTAAKPVVSEYAKNVPPVLLSAGHAKLCKVNVGDAFPAIELPQLSGGKATLESLAGARATIVAFWTADQWMSRSALRDLARAGGEGVAIVGVAEGGDAAAAQRTVAEAGAKFPQLSDPDGAALAQVGETALPRVYVLDSQRRVAWFDIEYSEATRRELLQTLAALTQ